MSDKSPDKSLEASRDFFAWIEANPKLVGWVKSPPLPLDNKKYALIESTVAEICREANIEPLTLYHADMPIPHVVCMPVKADKSKLVISNLLLQPPFKQEDVAMYIAHKLGHEFHGVKHALSKEEHRLVIAGFGAGTVASTVWGIRSRNETLRSEGKSLLDSDISPPPRMDRRQFMAASAAVIVNAAGTVGGWKPVFDHNNKARETEADREALRLLAKPEVLQSMLTHMRRWCIDNEKDPEIIYPGINARLMQAERLVEQQQQKEQKLGHFKNT